MNRKNEYPYDDDKLSGLDIAGLILAEWRTGRHQTIVEVTSAVHLLRTEMPRSVVFWLAYHTLQEESQLTAEPPTITTIWPVH
jgi:hypothetical protein